MKFKKANISLQLDLIWMSNVGIADIIISEYNYYIIQKRI